MPKSTRARGGTNALAGGAQNEAHEPMVVGKYLTIRDGSIEFSDGTGGLPDLRVFRDPATGGLYVGVLAIGSVPGNLSVGGNLAVTGNSTVGGNHTVTGTTTALGYFGAGGNVGLGSVSSQIAFFGAAGGTKPAVAGSRANTEAALKNLLAALATLGLITDSTTS
jgi:hypothetical protein